MTTDDLNAPTTGEESEPMSFRARTASVLALLSVLVIAFLWGWALFFPPSNTAPGILEDRSFPDAAEQICSNTAAELSQLPKAFQTTNPTERAVVVTESDVILSAMLDRLDALPRPADAGDAVNIDEWIADWRTYVGDRETYARALTTDPQARFYVTEKERRQVSEPVDFFARFNKMYNCVTPDDIE